MLLIALLDLARAGAAVAPPSQCLTCRAVAAPQLLQFWRLRLPGPRRWPSRQRRHRSPGRSEVLNIDECQALGEVERAAQAAGQDTMIERMVGGDRTATWRRAGRETCGRRRRIRYRVMRLGRSRTTACRARADDLQPGLRRGRRQGGRRAAGKSWRARRWCPASTTRCSACSWAGGGACSCGRSAAGACRRARARGEEKGMTDLNELTKRVDAGRQPRLQGRHWRGDRERERVPEQGGAAAAALVRRQGALRPPLRQAARRGRLGGFTGEEGRGGVNTFVYDQAAK